MPNHTDQTRIMLAFGYQAAWHGCTLCTPVPESLRETVGQLEKYNNTEFCVTYIPDEKLITSTPHSMLTSRAGSSLSEARFKPGRYHSGTRVIEGASKSGQ
jgi:hypothetical protein